MYFANPTYLWALLGLLVPIAIHLWSNKKGKVIKIGSTKFLRATDSPQSSSLNLNEIWLLLLRMFALILVVMIMAEPKIPSLTERSPITYVVEPTLLENEELKNILQDLPDKAEIRLFQQGLPPLAVEEFEEVETSKGAPPSYWQLLKELEGINTDSIVIFTNAYLSGFKGKRPATGTNAAWIVIDAEESSEKTLAISQRSDGFEVLKANMDFPNLSFQKESVSNASNAIMFNSAKDSARLISSENKEWLPLQSVKPYEVLLVYNENLSDQPKYFQAIFNSISTYLDRPVNLEVTENQSAFKLQDFDLLVALTDQPVSENQIKSIRYQSNEYAKLLVAGENQDQYLLTGLLNSENIVEENIPEQLIEIMDLHQSLKPEIDASDKRSLAEQEFKPVIQKTTENKAYYSRMNLLPWILMLLGLSFVIERIIARRRKQ